jgi:hypothetical protein
MFDLKDYRMETTNCSDSHRVAIATLLLALIGQLGCDPSASTKDAAARPPKAPAVPTPTEQQAPEKEEISKPVLVASGEQPWIEFEQLPWEAWYLQYLEGRRIGYSHVEVKKSTLPNNDKLIHINRTDCIEVAGNGTRAIFSRHIEAQEYSDGRLISMEDTSLSGENRAMTKGALAGGTFSATTTIGEEVTTNAVAWEPGAWGLMGLQAILMQHTPKPGEWLEAKVFIPQLYKIAKVELLAGQPDITTLPGGKTESLIPVDVVLWTEDAGMRSRNWVNDRGEVLKTIALSGPNLSTFWTTKEIALRVRDEFELDQYLPRRVPLAGGEDLVNTLEQAHKVVYTMERNAKETGAEVFSLLANSPRQQVASLNALTAQATVLKLDPEQLPTVADEAVVEEPGATCRMASALVISDSQVVKQLAEELLGDLHANVDTGNSVASIAKALQMTRGLHKKLAEKPLDRQVASPLQTIRDTQADCVEQAILLTALLRSQQIPARVASGLAIDPENKNLMRFKMWTEAWLSNRWIPLDATTGQVVGADHVKMKDSDLADDNPYKAILPVMQELKGLELKVVSQE